jgi:hypothetical protein
MSIQTKGHKQSGILDRFMIYSGDDRMKTKDQVCSLEQAKKLVELGVVLDTTLLWYKTNDGWELIPGKTPSCKFNKKNFERFKFYPALNVAELGVLLPYDERFGAAWYSGANERGEIYCHIYNDAEEQVFHAKTEAQARADALIWLIEKGFRNPKDLKL